MEKFNFSDIEIKEELDRLGYYNISNERFLQFKLDLQKLIDLEASQNKFTTSFSDCSHDCSYSSRDKSCDGSCDSSTTERSDPGYKKNRYQFEPPLYGISESNGDLNDAAKLQPYSSTDDTSRKFIRRKTLRKYEDGSRVVDESVTESEPGDLDALHVRLRDLDMNYPRKRCDSASEMSLSERSKTISVIYPNSQHPHYQNIRKCDPVSRYQQFREEWSNYRTPGEMGHRNLRWHIRELMVQRDPLPVRAPQRFIRSNYVVPTSKKRSKLRWRIRMDMEQRTMPIREEFL